MPAVSQAQRKLFGMAYAYKKGDLKSVSEEVEKLADSMSLEELKKYAETSEEDLPKTIGESTKFMSFKDFLNEQEDVIKNDLQQWHEQIKRYMEAYNAVTQASEINPNDLELGKLNQHKRALKDAVLVSTKGIIEKAKQARIDIVKTVSQFVHDDKIKSMMTRLLQNYGGRSQMVREAIDKETRAAVYHADYLKTADKPYRKYKKGKKKKKSSENKQ